jgi:hypothetical protein
MSIPIGDAMSNHLLRISPTSYSEYPVIARSESDSLEVWFATPLTTLRQMCDPQFNIVLFYLARLTSKPVWRLDGRQNPDHLQNQLAGLLQLSPRSHRPTTIEVEEEGLHGFFIESEGERRAVTQASSHKPV